MARREILKAKIVYLGRSTSKGRVMCEILAEAAVGEAETEWIRLIRFADGARLHLITLSALASTFCGIVRPICFAVLRLITSSNFVGCSTGRSAGLAPFRILST